MYISEDSRVGGKSAELRSLRRNDGECELEFWTGKKKTAFKKTIIGSAEWLWLRISWKQLRQTMERKSQLKNNQNFFFALVSSSEMISLAGDSPSVGPMKLQLPYGLAGNGVTMPVAPCHLVTSVLFSSSCLGPVMLLQAGGQNRPLESLFTSEGRNDVTTEGNTDPQRIFSPPALASFFVTPPPETGSSPFLMDPSRFFSFRFGVVWIAPANVFWSSVSPNSALCSVQIQDVFLFRV